MAERRKGGTRRRVIAGFFIVLGLLALGSYVPQLGAAKPQITKLALALPDLVFALPTALSLVLIGLIFLVGGVLSYLPQAGRLSNWLLWVSGALLIPAVLIWAAAGKQTNATSLFGEALRLGTPIALGAMAGIWAERSGVINIAIEGMMLTGAAFGFAAFAFTGNILLGVLTAVLLSGGIALLHGLLSITFRTDQIISGTVINILAIGVTGYLRRQFIVSSGGGRVTLPSLDQALTGIGLPDLGNALTSIPVVGPLFLSGKPIFYAMFVVVALTHLIFFYTRWGLRTRAVGENPRAADTVGINVIRTRYMNIFISGCIAGLAGAWFSLETVGNFDDGMTAGKGFIALAAMIFGKWMPFGAFGGAMLFGFTESLAVRSQILQLQVFGTPVPVQFMQVLPYVTTMVVLAGLIGRAIGPAAVGQPYEKA